MKIDLTAAEFQSFVCDAMDVNAEQFRMLAKNEDLRATASPARKTGFLAMAEEIQKLSTFFRNQTLSYEIPDELLVPNMPAPVEAGTDEPTAGMPVAFVDDNAPRVGGTAPLEGLPTATAPVVTGVVHTEPEGVIELGDSDDEVVVLESVEPVAVRRGRPPKKVVAE